jgi:thiol-disulfide isomerase/thioredoxin
MWRVSSAVAAAVLVFGSLAFSGDEKPPSVSPPASRGSSRDVSRETVPIGGAVPAEATVVPFPRPEGDAPVGLANLGAGTTPLPLVALFWSARCPVCRRYAAVVKSLAATYEGKVRFAFVFPNPAETDAEVKAILDGGDVVGHFALDRTQEAVSRLCVGVTPTALVLDAGGILRYRGPIDDDRRNRHRDCTALLASAIDAVLAGKSIENPEPRPFGCSVRLVRR